MRRNVHGRSKQVAAVVLALCVFVASCGSGTDVRHTNVVAGEGEGALATSTVDDFFRGDYYRSAIVVGTERHVITARGEVITDVFTFEGDFPDRGHVHCWISHHVDSSGAGGGGGGCADELDPEPTTSGSFGPERSSSFLLWAPVDAAWFRVELSNGDSVTANVVNRAGHAAWASVDGEYAMRVVALDADFEEIWSEDRERPPPMPDVSGALEEVHRVVDGE